VRSLGRRFARVAPLAAAAILAAAVPALAGVRVVGGGSVRVQSAPWTVLVRQATGANFTLCTGTVIDAQHVLTAAHCVFDPNRALASVTALSIRAGISSYTTSVPGDAEQDRDVSSFRVHPGYRGPGVVSEDDVAVLALSVPLDLTGQAVQPVALPAPGSAFPAGVGVGFAGFGRQVAGTNANGSLYWFAGTVDDQGTCGDFSNSIVFRADAIALCASAPSASVCNGDSGAGLVTLGDSRVLVGVVSAGQGGCLVGGHTLFTSVTAPEILRFVQGEDVPPTAPRRSTSTVVRLAWGGELRVGAAVTCSSGGWDGAPSLTYVFVDSSGRELERGSPTYRLAAADVGSSVACQAVATNAGGSALAQTDPTPPVGPAPPLDIAPVATVGVVRGRRATVRVVLQAADAGGKVGVCLTPPVRVGRRVCASRLISAGVAGEFPFTLAVPISAAAPLGPARVAIAAVAGPSRATATALVQVAGG
jgi:hypothetical protein